MQGYIDLIREHINFEKDILFRIANKTLSPCQQHELLKEFEALDSNDPIQKFINDIEGLEIVYSL